MKKLSVIVNVLFVLFWIIVVVSNLCYDLAHPERWKEFIHDPRVYGPLIIVDVLVIVWCESWSQYYRRRTERGLRLMSMLKVTKRLYAAGRRKDGDKAMALYRRADATHNEKEGIRLAKEFSELFGT